MKDNRISDASKQINNRKGKRHINNTIFPISVSDPTVSDKLDHMYNDMRQCFMMTSMLLNDMKKNSDDQVNLIKNEMQVLQAEIEKKLVLRNVKKEEGEEEGEDGEKGEKEEKEEEEGEEKGAIALYYQSIKDSKRFTDVIQETTGLSLHNISSQAKYAFFKKTCLTDWNSSHKKKKWIDRFHKSKNR